MSNSRKNILIYDEGSAKFSNTGVKFQCFTINEETGLKVKDVLPITETAEFEYLEDISDLKNFLFYYKNVVEDTYLDVSTFLKDSDVSNFLVFVGIADGVNFEVLGTAEWINGKPDFESNRKYLILFKRTVVGALEAYIVGRTRENTCDIQITFDVTEDNLILDLSKTFPDRIDGFGPVYDAKINWDFKIDDEQRYQIGDAFEKKASLTHIYEKPGKYTVCIHSGVCEGLGQVPNNAIKCDSAKGLKYFGKCFAYCTKFESFPYNFFHGITKQSYLNGCFQGTKISGIPENLFIENNYIRKLESLFSECVFLNDVEKDESIIPERLFEPLKNLEELDSVFDSCYYITKVPKNIFHYNKKLRRIERCFALIGTDLGDAISGIETEERTLDNIPNDIYTGTNIFDSTAVFSGLGLGRTMRHPDDKNNPHEVNLQQAYDSLITKNKSGDVFVTSGLDLYTTNDRKDYISLKDGIVRLNASDAPVPGSTNQSSIELGLYNIEILKRSKLKSSSPTSQLLRLSEGEIVFSNIETGSFSNVLSGTKDNFVFKNQKITTETGGNKKTSTNIVDLSSLSTSPYVSISQSLIDSKTNVDQKTDLLLSNSKISLGVKDQNGFIVENPFTDTLKISIIGAPLNILDAKEDDQAVTLRQLKEQIENAQLNHLVIIGEWDATGKTSYDSLPDKTIGSCYVVKNTSTKAVVIDGTAWQNGDYLVVAKSGCIKIDSVDTWKEILENTTDSSADWSGTVSQTKSVIGASNKTLFQITNQSNTNTILQHPSGTGIQLGNNSINVIGGAPVDIQQYVRATGSNFTSEFGKGTVSGATSGYSKLQYSASNNTYLKQDYVTSSKVVSGVSYKNASSEYKEETVLASNSQEKNFTNIPVKTNKEGFSNFADNEFITKSVCEEAISSWSDGKFEKSINERTLYFDGLRNNANYYGNLFYSKNNNISGIYKMHGINVYSSSNNSQGAFPSSEGCGDLICAIYSCQDEEKTDNVVNGKKLVCFSTNAGVQNVLSNIMEFKDFTQIDGCEDFTPVFKDDQIDGDGIYLDLTKPYVMVYFGYETTDTGIKTPPINFSDVASCQYSLNNRLTQYPKLWYTRVTAGSTNNTSNENQSLGLLYQNGQLKTVTNNYLAVFDINVRGVDELYAFGLNTSGKTVLSSNNSWSGVNDFYNCRSLTYRVASTSGTEVTTIDYLKNIVYPIGSVFTTTVNNGYPELLGTTWTQFGTQTIGSTVVYYYKRTG